MDTIKTLQEIFQYDFMVRALIAGLVIAIIAPLLGIFLVVRRYALMADALAHVALAGVALGLLLNIHPLIASTVTGAVAALGIERLRASRKLFGESVLSLFLSGSLAVAVVLMSAHGGLTTNVLSFLFGSITTVSQEELYAISIAGALVLGCIIFFWRRLFLVVFDEEIAQTSGLRVRLLNALLVLLTTLTVTLAMRVVGALLIGALMVIPVMTALQFKKGFFHTTIMAVAFSLVAVVGGLFVSFIFDVASGGMIVIVALGFFLTSLLLRRAN